MISRYHTACSLRGKETAFFSSVNSVPSSHLRRLNPHWLVAYFHSGWVFFVPYLLFYLLYAWQEWPVNPSAAGAAGGGRVVPALLHVYWVLHGLHVLLGGLALRHLWMSPDRRRLRTRARLWSLLRWGLLGLLFLLPGVFLEYPADPWEHLRRINAWSTIHEVREYSHWIKSGYFFTYSLVGGFTSTTWQLPLCSLYVAGLSLLLCRQYYALARAVGLPSRPAFLFATLQAVLLGNNLFSFYRYYGLSSTIVAQIGAVALTSYVIRASRLTRAAAPTPDASPVRWLAPGRLLALLGLLALMACNHLQALGIAALGVTAVAIQVTVQRRRALLGWLSGAVLLASVAVVLWWPVTPALEQAMQHGWLNRWHGFNLWSFHSPAAWRAWHILGIFGALNLLAGLVLALRNHLAGWLTILPVLALGLPLVAIPFADLVTRDDPGNILVFHRLLLAVPSGLALVVAGRWAVRRWRKIHGAPAPALAFGGLVLTLGLLTITPVQGPWLNRFWNLVAKSPTDLAMQPVWDGLRAGAPPLRGREARYASSSRISFVLETLKPVPTVYAPYFYRGYINGGNLPSMDFAFINRVLANLPARAGSVIIVADPTLLLTPYSQAAHCSQHWLAQEAALAFAGAAELHAQAEAAGLKVLRTEGGISYYLTPPHP
jgi:hypothetical protein